MYQKFETICLEVEDIMYQVCFLVIKKKKLCIWYALFLDNLNFSL